MLRNFKIHTSHGTLCSARESADVAQLVEHVLGKDEVSGSIPDIGSNEV